MNKKKMIKLYLKNGVVLPRLNAYEALEKLVERDTPKKPITNKIIYDIEEHFCPVCNSTLDLEDIIEINYCVKCGQKIDWNKELKENE